MEFGCLTQILYQSFERTWSMENNSPDT